MATKKTAKPKYPFVIKKDFLQVTIDGNPFTLNSTHATFEKLRKALETGNWKQVPKLVSLARTLVQASAGSVTVEQGVVRYKGKEVDSRLSSRILGMVNENKDVRHLLLFMDNLYQNPQPEAVNEFYDWLITHDLPITDDGHFLAYKSVDDELKDEHTHTIDNSPGQIIMMPRNVADLSWRVACSSGFHLCSKQYGLYGSRVVAVKVNPCDVIAAPEGEHKIRVCRYEVLYELGMKGSLEFQKEGFSQLEKKLVVEVAKEAKELRALLSKSSTVKRLIRNGKVSADYVKKASYARLKSMAQRFDVLPKDMTQAQEQAAEKSKVVLPLRAARQAAGLTTKQMADAMDLSVKVVTNIETKYGTDQPVATYHADDYMNAIAALTGIRNLSNSAISYPHAVKSTGKKVA